MSRKKHHALNLIPRSSPTGSRLTTRRVVFAPTRRTSELAGDTSRDVPATSNRSAFGASASAHSKKARGRDPPNNTVLGCGTGLQRNDAVAMTCVDDALSKCKVSAAQESTFRQKGVCVCVCVCVCVVCVCSVCVCVCVDVDVEGVYECVALMIK